MHWMRLRSSRVLVGMLVAGGMACSSGPATERAQRTADVPGRAPSASPADEEMSARVFDQTEAHADHPPHGGSVIELGSHLAHAELVIVPDTGEVTVHMLDGTGQGAKRIAQPVILAEVQASGRTMTLELNAVAAEWTGERSGDSSQFSARTDDLLRVGDATVILKWVGVEGQVFTDVPIQWPAAAM